MDSVCIYSKLSIAEVLSQEVIMSIIPVKKFSYNNLGREVDTANIEM
jgi:hypothetical protein